MSIEELIRERYGSVDQMIKETNTLISRSYLYQIVSGEKTNLTIDMSLELCKLLNISLEELVKILNETKKV